MAKLPFNKTWTKEGTGMALMERAGKLFNVDGNFLLPVEDQVIEQAIEDTMAPIGTFIKGSGSSGKLRRNKVQASFSSGSKSAEAKLHTIPGSGWSNVDDKKSDECC